MKLNTPQKIDNHFGKKLASLRGKLRMTQKEIAAHLGIKQELVSRMERTEKMPKPEQLNSIAKIYNMSIEDVKNYDPETNYVNNFYDEVKNVYNAKEIVVNGISDAFETIIKDQQFLDGEEVRLVMTFKIEKK
jgi:transcriptional regulator with XRE-family HTH domain